MYLEEWLVIVGIIAVVSGFMSFFWRWLLDIRMDRKVDRLSDEVYSLQQTIRSQAGVSAREDKRAEEQMFMAQAAEILKGEGEMKDKVMKVMALNPGMALRLAGKIGIKI